jgi:hypothetical protein
MRLMLGQANSDAVNRASQFSYGEAAGITQTVRNYGASLGFAILGTILITEFRSRITSSLIAKGLPGPAASPQAAKIAQLQGGNGNVAAIPPFIRGLPGATRDVLYVTALIMRPATSPAGGTRCWTRRFASSIGRTRQPDAARGPEPGGAVERNGDVMPYSELPYFWSNQYDWKMKFVGRPGAAVEIVDESVADGRFVADYTTDGRLVGVLSTNLPQEVAPAWQRILESFARIA